MDLVLCLADFLVLTTLCGSSLIMRVLLSILYSMDIGSVSVFTVQIDDTSENKALLLTQRWGGIFQKWGHGHIEPLQTKSQGAQPLPPPVPTPLSVGPTSCK